MLGCDDVARRKKRRQRATISRTEAVRRLEQMVEQIELDLKTALWAEAVLESANDLVVGDPNREYPGADAYNTIRESLAVNLSLSLARLFDNGFKSIRPNNKDLASIPLAINLLKQKRCRRVFVERARGWMPPSMGMADINAEGCEESIDLAVSKFSSFRNSSAGRRADRRLRDFRNFQIAHSMFDDKNHEKPMYSDLFSLTDIAIDIVQPIKLAVQGNNMALDDLEEHYRQIADIFWRFALNFDAGRD